MLLHQERYQVGQHHDEGQGCRQKAHGVAKGQGEHAVCGHVLVVDEADEIAGPAAARGEGVLDYQDEGDSVEQEAAEEEGGYQEVALESFVWFFSCEGPFLALRQLHIHSHIRIVDHGLPGLWGRFHQGRVQFIEIKPL